MKKEFKIVICGGGSTYTAGIVKNLLEEEELVTCINRFLT